MSTIVKTVDVEVPVTTAYNQWTQFESFPRFMEGVEQVEQISDTRTHWRTKIGGVSREFDAEITEQHPDERVAWQTEQGVHHAGVVTFHRLNNDTTRVTLQMDYQPEGVTEKVADWVGVVERRTQKDLENFKEFIESRGAETGAWRGDVPREPQSGEGMPTPPPPPGTPSQASPDPVDPRLGRPEAPPS